MGVKIRKIFALPPHRQIMKVEGKNGIPKKDLQHPRWAQVGPKKHHIILFNQMRKKKQCVTTWATRAGNIPGILQELKLTLADGLEPKNLI